MSNHKIHFAGARDSMQARCSCKKRSKIGTRSEVEDWFIAHLQEIERIRAYLGSRTPSLRTQWAWFVKQAEDSDNDPDDRVLWQQLADEVERFLASREPVTQEETLF